MAEKWQKTIAATSRKRGKAQRKGQFAKSNEVSIVASLAMLMIALGFLGHAFYAGLRAYLEHSITHLPRHALTDDDGIELIRLAFFRVLEVTAPISLLFMLGAVTVGVFQTGGISFSAERLRVEFNRLNPASGIKKLIGTEGLMKLAVGLAKLAVIAMTLYVTISPRVDEILLLANKQIPEILAYTLWIFFLVILRVTIALAVIAFIDQRFQKWRYEENLKMTKEEHKEEMKSVEGNPKTKKRILEQQRKILLQRMFQDTEQADVVVTNPTHYAVALKYTPGQPGAPRIVAKGMNRVAEKIRKIARQHDIPVVENKPLARALYQVASVGQEIPEKLYRPVAELLAYVFKLRERRAAKRSQR